MLRITISLKSKWAFAYISNCLELEKVDATDDQFLVRHELAIPQSLALGCKLHRDAPEKVTTTVATNVTHAASHSVSWPTTLVEVSQCNCESQ